MKKSLFPAAVMLLSFCLMSCNGNKPVVAKKSLDVKESAETVELASKITIAILDFENNSITDSSKLEPLKKGFASMISTDLMKVRNLNVVERTKIETLLQEMQLGQAGIISTDTALEVGKIVGAEKIVFGSFVAIGNQMRVDVRMIDIETSLLMLAESMTGRADDVIGIEKELVGKIIHALKVSR